MRRLTMAMLVFGLSIAALAGCQRSSVISIPPPPPPRMFVSDSSFSGHGAFGVAVYNQPLLPTSTAAFNLAAANGLAGEPSGSAFDGKGNFYVIDDLSSSIYIYSAPVTATSTPATIIGPQGGFANAFGLALDASGDIWVPSCGNNTIFEFKPPFATGVAVPALTMNATTPALACPSGIVFDPLGRMFASNFGSSQVNVFQPPFTAASTSIANITVPSGPTGLAVDLKDRLVVAEYSTGNLDVYGPPYATGMLKSFTIAPPIVGGGASAETYQPIFGPDGNLYVPYQTDGTTLGNVSVFMQPLSASSTPSIVIPGTGQPSAVSFGP